MNEAQDKPPVEGAVERLTARAPKKPVPARGELLGILNAQGEFWTYSTFQTEAEARAYMADFNRAFNPPMDLSRHTIIPVRVVVSALSPSSRGKG